MSRDAALRSNSLNDGPVTVTAAQKGGGGGGGAFPHPSKRVAGGVVRPYVRPKNAHVYVHVLLELREGVVDCHPGRERTRPISLLLNAPRGTGVQPQRARFSLCWK